MTNNPIRTIASLYALILAGGQGRRVGGQDKGLISVHGMPMVQHACEVVSRQTDAILISANRNLAHYTQFGYPVIADETADFGGPLMGIRAATTYIKRHRPSDWPQCLLLTIPCDVINVPHDLAGLLQNQLTDTKTDVCILQDRFGIQPLVALYKLEKLDASLASQSTGGRQMRAWIKSLHFSIVDLSQQGFCLLNLNTPQDIQHAEQHKQHAR